VQERLIAALVPNAADRPEVVAPAPLPMLPTLRRVTDAGSAALLVVTARMDGSGRVHERILLRTLGWEPGHRLDIDTLHGVIVIAANPTGPHAVDHRGALQLPAALRHLCGIEPGPPLVLAAAIPAQVVVAHPAIVVAELLAAHYTTLLTNHGAS
jgi:hypothetical protein